MIANDRKTIVFAGGGTGGHLLPGLAVAAELTLRGLNVRPIFVGSQREAERQIVAQHGYEHLGLPVEPSSTAWRSPARFAARTWQSARAARGILARCRAALVVGLGGFASVPVVWAARLAGIPIILLEQNVVPGRATTWLCRRAVLTCLGFADAAHRLPENARHNVTGNPVRAEIAALAARPPAGGDRKTLLVLGGGQGARGLNEAFLSCVERRPETFAGWTIVHQAGPHDAESAGVRYAALKIDARVSGFFEDLVEVYAKAGLAVTRAGALTLAELACAGVPALLVPHRRTIRNHQRTNAYAFEHVGAARIVSQSRLAEVTANRLGEQLAPLVRDAELRSRMARAIRSLARPRAAASVADCVSQLIAVSTEFPADGK